MILVTLDKDTLKGKDVRTSDKGAATLYIQILSSGISEYFGITSDDVEDTFGKTVTVCPHTITKGGNIALAVPNCIRGLDFAPQQFTVEPGRLQLNIQNSPQLFVTLETKECFHNILPNDSIFCTIIFGPVHTQGEIIPKPNSDFGKFRLVPSFILLL